MNLLLLAETALREILAHKFRSLLSMLGIVLGVSSLVATMALTAGIETGTRSFMEQIGGLELVTVANKEISASRMDFWNLSPGRTLKDALAIRASAPLISHISPEMNHGAALSNGVTTERYLVTGVWPDHFVVNL
ncbi:MAG: ABC transporter permease, partial [Terrimicrobiaceae bacterium]|nr:ABC transporter permease [Terrimicrobiaceae bacterium]